MKLQIPSVNQSVSITHMRLVGVICDGNAMMMMGIRNGKMYYVCTLLYKKKETLSETLELLEDWANVVLVETTDTKYLV